MTHPTARMETVDAHGCGRAWIGKRAANALHALLNGAPVAVQVDRPPEWFLGYRDITSATNKRTSIATILPATAISSHASRLQPLGQLHRDALDAAREWQRQQAEEAARQEHNRQNPTLFT